jgi:hypothetical protein
MPADTTSPLLVTLFSGPDFTGTSQQFAAGSYDTGALVQGIGDKAARSIKVPAGLVAILCSDSGFQGARVSFAQDAADMMAFDGLTSALFVVPAPVLASAIDESQYYNLRVTGTDYYLTLFGTDDTCMQELMGYTVGPDPTVPKAQFRFTNFNYSPGQPPIYRITCRQTGGDVSVAAFPQQLRADPPYFALQGWSIAWTDASASPGVATISPAQGAFSSTFLDVVPNRLGTGDKILQAALSINSGTWDIVPVMQTCFPGATVVNTDALKDSAYDYAINAALGLAGVALDAEVPGGSVMLSLIYGAVFPGADMADILGKLAAELLNETFAAIANDDIAKALGQLKVHQNWFANDYVQNRQADIAANNFTPSLAALLTYATSTIPVSMTLIDPQLSLNNGVWTSPYDPNIVVNRCLTGFTAFSSLAVLRWSMLTERVYLTACGNGDVATAVSDLSSALSADAIVLKNMLDFLVNWRRMNVNGSFSSAQVGGEDGNSAYTFMEDTLVITEQAVPNSTRNVLNITEDNDSRHGMWDPWTADDVTKWVNYYRDELEWDFRNVRFPQIACVAPARQQAILSNTQTYASALQAALANRTAYIDQLKAQVPKDLDPTTTTAAVLVRPEAKAGSLSTGHRTGDHGRSHHRHHAKPAAVGAAQEQPN